ncbi:cysteine--tRNA ligase [Bryobacter aggregatus]|uniref:cysteine--tRNA ligase n=1 Tax=Bryobacter aggregatus TaxID=360054 RepID=UPI0004E1041A|nr:cysteine--tRNA ligase [Bryobacter aggregatus]
MALRLYNTLSLLTEEFQPADGKTVRMYSCGPTVYNFAHIGNLRTFTFNDTLRRWLQYRGFALHHVMNITDVEDKIIRKSMELGVPMGEYTQKYEKFFLEDMATLRLQQPEQIVRATEHIPEMVELIETLTSKGFTYESDGSVYYRISQFPEYGKLSHSDFSGIQAGARVDNDEYEKESARDFVLWKSRKGEEPAWEAPFGCGRPGWHIECSAMAMKYLGATLDIHTGGVDLAFPHHENEIAQSEGATGKPFARFWIHCEHLNVDMQKMSKSVGNIYTLRELMEMGHTPEALRFLLMSVPYRKKLNFTLESLKGAQTSIERLRNYELRLKTDHLAPGTNEQITELAAKALAKFEESMDDDLNTAEALAAVYEFVRETNSLMDQGAFLEGNRAAALDLLARFDSLFDVLQATRTEDGLDDAAIEALIAERTAAKKAKNFGRSDEIRSQLLEAGVTIEDTKDGVRWKRK